MDSVDSARRVVSARGAACAAVLWSFCSRGWLVGGGSLPACLEDGGCCRLRPQEVKSLAQGSWSRRFSLVQPLTGESNSWAFSDPIVVVLLIASSGHRWLRPWPSHPLLVLLCEASFLCQTHRALLGSDVLWSHTVMSSVGLLPLPAEGFAVGGREGRLMLVPFLLC